MTVPLVKLQRQVLSNFNGYAVGQVSEECTVQVAENGKLVDNLGKYADIFTYAGYYFLTYYGDSPSDVRTHGAFRTVYHAKEYFEGYQHKGVL